MYLFEKPGKHNSQHTFEMALAKSQELSCPVVIASSTGASALGISKMAKSKSIQLQLLVVTYVAGFGGKGTLSMPEETRLMLEKANIPVIRAAHALSAGERALSTAAQGIYPLEVAAKTLRMFGQGVKVCIEVAIMAMDTGLLSYGKPVVALAGTGHGADTAMLITPSYTASLFDTKIHEILCKPCLA